MVAQVLITPEQAIRWTGSQLEVFGQESTTYTVLFVDENGCIDERTLDVRVTEIGGIYVPNVFHPGSSSGNAVWTPEIGAGYRLEMVRIYDRWGNEQYAAVGTAAWDGTRHGRPCPSGVYAYQLVLTPPDGAGALVLRGDITLLR